LISALRKCHVSVVHDGVALIGYVAIDHAMLAYFVLGIFLYVVPVNSYVVVPVSSSLGVSNSKGVEHFVKNSSFVHCHSSAFILVRQLVLAEQQQGILSSVDQILVGYMSGKSVISSAVFTGTSVGWNVDF